MMNSETLVSSVREADDFGGVFEYDGEAGYFYLYDLRAPDGEKVLAATQVVAGKADLEEGDAVLSWSRDQAIVALSLRGVLVAAFEVETRRGFGGRRQDGGFHEIPRAIADQFIVVH